jgi:gas vesicle protein
MEDDNNLSYFFLGMGLGVAAGILFAPKAGPETREMIKAKAGEGTDYLKKRTEEIKDSATGMVDKGKSLLNRQKDQLNDAVEAGKQAYREAVGSPAERNVSNPGY